ncbi:chemotaxis protein CheA [Acerihabitans sp. TG2]|uniref:chemotaxis protein CheA n=1 Tax=Acerihabitans sp. TG2 TaxID=3096008 RepID=UPI002B237E8E|nr:chemotaxis protein CheA [Acerihabitans sp. TG2]MEA9393220.1 chemotaxis protein CheA [Acerihabitans sp. TG2]
MTPILQQFLEETREFLQAISQKLLQLEETPADAAMMTELFRFVHTLKGNSGLFEFPEMTRVLHAAEDLMSVVRDGHLGYSQSLADPLLDAVDFVGMLCDEIEATGQSSANHAAVSATLAASLRALIPPSEGRGDAVDTSCIDSAASTATELPAVDTALRLALMPEALRMVCYRQASKDRPLYWVTYTPDAECFFVGEDPFFQARQLPELQWQRVSSIAPWAALPQFDAYHCVLRFEMLSGAPQDELEDYFRYVVEQVSIVAVPAIMLAIPTGDKNGDPVPEDVVSEALLHLQGGDLASLARLADTMLESSSSTLWLASVLRWLLLVLEQEPENHAVLRVLIESLRNIDPPDLLRMPVADRAVAQAITPARPMVALNPVTPATPGSLCRRAEDVTVSTKTLKVDQGKIDRLMNLIGEMVVSKNALPYLAVKAEEVYGVRELAREIKSQYAVINRIAEEMQDAILQVRMLPVSFVFQRFPRLVRDISRKLGKDVNLVLEGENTEADKNIIEALADPLIHIVRNSLDHGLEIPAVRLAAGKPAKGQLTIRATQEAGRVLIDIIDDGKGIDPALIKRKAYEKGIIDDATLERITDQDAVNLVFAAGFSTVEVVSDLSGRGVGMDVVRAALAQVNGSATLDSTVGKGTRLRLSLPLSMAVTNVMIIKSNGQIFGVPMDMVVETVRIPRANIRYIKNHQTAVLRGRIVPLRSLNELLATNQPQRANEEDELATLVIRMAGEPMGVVVDDFLEVADIILKPMTGILAGLPGYAGSALMGDGSVLMILNPKELV